MRSQIREWPVAPYNDIAHVEVSAHYLPHLGIGIQTNENTNTVVRHEVVNLVASKRPYPPDIAGPGVCQLTRIVMVSNGGLYRRVVSRQSEWQLGGTLAFGTDADLLPDVFEYSPRVKVKRNISVCLKAYPRASPTRHEPRFDSVSTNHSGPGYSVICRQV